MELRKGKQLMSQGGITWRGRGFCRWRAGPLEAFHEDVSTPFLLPHLGALLFWPLWRGERKVQRAQGEAILAQSFWWPHPNPAASCPIKGSNHEYMLHNVPSTLWVICHLLFMARGSIVVIPLWLMKTLRLKEATWFAQDYTTERCRRHWKPGVGAPRFTLTHFSKLTRETLAWASKTQHFFHAYREQS